MELVWQLLFDALGDLVLEGFGDFAIADGVGGALAEFVLHGCGLGWGGRVGRDVWFSLVDLGLMD